MEPQKASFKFINFKVPKFSYEESGKPKADLKLNFKPSGKYFTSEGRFELTIQFTGYEEDSERTNSVIDIIGVSEFQFSEKIDFEEIPSYFYSNSIPIVFPYLRAFISTLTLQANTGVIMLGLLNFTSMAEALKTNTQKI